LEAKNIKPICLDPLNSYHLLDHIAPLSLLLNAPMLSRDPENEKLLRKFYPPIEVIPIISLENSKEMILKNYNLLIHTNFWPKPLMQAFFNGCNMRSIYTPHGVSDKHSDVYWLEQFKEQDLTLLYGEHMVDFLKEKKVYDEITNPIFMGNLRYRFYLNHIDFYKDLLQKEIFPFLNNDKKTLIYAPTFQEISSFYQLETSFIRALSDEFNVILKLHPNLESNHPEVVYPFLGKLEHMQNVVPLIDFPPVYPLLDIADAYIGDFSSVGYDFLTFNRPMFFISNSTISINRLRNLHSCGEILDVKKPDTSLMQIKKSLEKDLYKERRKAMYEYAFLSISDKELKNAIIQAHSKEEEEQKLPIDR